MTVDSEHIYAQSTLTSRPNLQFSSYDDRSVGTACKMNNIIMGEDKRKTISDQDIVKSGNNTELLLTQDKCGETRSVLQVHDLVSIENSFNGGGKEPANHFHFNKVKSSEKETKFYTDKSVNGLELSELMVYFKEFEDGDYHVVKDICVDDGLPFLSKVLVEDSEIHGKFNSEHSDMDVKIDLDKENVENEASILSRTNPFAESDRKTGADNKFGSVTLNGIIEEDMDETVAASILNGINPFVEYDSKTELAMKFDPERPFENGDKSFKVSMDNETPIFNGNPFLERDSEGDIAKESVSDILIGNCEEIDEIVNMVADEKTTTVLEAVQDFDVSNLSEQSNSDKDEEQQQSDQDTSEGRHSVDSVVPSTAEESNNCDQAKEVTFDSQVKNESITSDLNSSLPETSGREEDPESTDDQKSVESLSRPSIEEEMPDSRTASSRSFFIQHGFGETSFSAADPLSGPISYSGPIPYSGSISHRSDSSTTSTRSFAFPTLYSDWTSSPVRMAKADRRQLRKHRGWLMSLLCCRF